MGDEQGSPDSSQLTTQWNKIRSPRKDCTQVRVQSLAYQREHNSVDHQLDFAGHSNDMGELPGNFSQKHYSWIMYILIIQNFIRLLAGLHDRRQFKDQHKATETALSTVATGDLIHHVGKTVDQEVGNSLPREKTQPGLQSYGDTAKAKSLVVHMNAHIYPKRCNDHFLTHFIHKQWS
ncbi:hypothetical protein PSHT_04402 [Puccinia striiformis]|uniref:Uncharacterized protein n=1 Tax=Puccinia striiformis TaxID=27350 RepID=A0A2S4WCX0_9BASI|nr:hypothetical protein PSHT_04402 [Puccinia striiformis]